MSQLQKRIAKFNAKPIPNDITFADVEVLAEYYGCRIKTGGKHVKVAYKPLGRIVPIPRHGDNVEEAYICELKKLFIAIEEARQ